MNYGQQPFSLTDIRCDTESMPVQIKTNEEMKKEICTDFYDFFFFFQIMLKS